MATTKTVRNDPNEILIIRREVVDRVIAGRDGEHPLLRATFMAAADYIGQYATGTGMQLEWEFDGVTFRASVDAS